MKTLSILILKGRITQYIRELKSKRYPLKAVALAYKGWHNVLKAYFLKRYSPLPSNIALIKGVRKR